MKETRKNLEIALKMLQIAINAEKNLFLRVQLVNAHDRLTERLITIITQQGRK